MFCHLEARLSLKSHIQLSLPALSGVEQKREHAHTRARACTEDSSLQSSIPNAWSSLGSFSPCRIVFNLIFFFFFKNEVKAQSYVAFFKNMMAAHMES